MDCSWLFHFLHHFISRTRKKINLIFFAFLFFSWEKPTVFGFAAEFQNFLNRKKWKNKKINVFSFSLFRFCIIPTLLECFDDARFQSSTMQNAIRTRQKKKKEKNGETENEWKIIVSRLVEHGNRKIKL